MKLYFINIIALLSFISLIVVAELLNFPKAEAIDNALIQNKSIEAETQIPDTEIAANDNISNENSVDDINKFISNWKASWEQQNFESYINCYSLKFKNNNGQNFEQWKTYRKPRVTNKDKIEITLTNVKIKEINNGFEASFTQEYKSGNIDSTTNKKLIINAEGNQLKITSEDTSVSGDDANRINQANAATQKVTQALDSNKDDIFQELAQSETPNPANNTQDKDEVSNTVSAISENTPGDDDPYAGEIPLSPIKMIELPNMNIVEVESLIDDIVFELKTKKKFTVLPLSLDSKVPEVDSVDFYSHVSRTFKEGVVMDIFLGYMKRPRRTPQLCIYSVKTENSEVVSNTAYTNTFIEQMISSVFDKTQEFESSLAIKDLDFKLINLSYVDPDGALFGLKAMGYSVITDDAALWSDNAFEGKLDIQKVTATIAANQDNIFQDIGSSKMDQTSNNTVNQAVTDERETSPKAISYLPSSIKASRLPIIVKMPSPDAKSTGLVGGNTLNKYLNQQNTTTTDLATDATTTPSSNQLTVPPTADLPVPLSGQVSSQLLVIYNPNDKKMLSRVNKAIFELIDKPAKQILIEGLVLEMSTSELSKLGVKWSTSRANGSVISLGSLAQITSVDAGSGAANAALTNAGGTGQGLPTFAANLEALITKTNSQVLSKPSLLTLDNRQASIKVGTNIPIAASVTTAVGASTAGFTYLPVGIMLNIRPRISDDNKEISMLIDATVSQKVVNEDVIIYNSAGTAMASAPTTTLRKIQTYARVDNEEPLIIAGLMSKEKTMSKSGVPLLSDIPLLGNLFSFQSPSESDTEIVLIITPTIIESEKNTIKVNLDDEFLKSKLFKNNYRITSSDVSDMDGVMNNQVYRNFQEKISALKTQNPQMLEQEPFIQWRDGSVPGENNFVAGKISEIESRLNLSQDVSLDNLMITKTNDAGRLEKVSLNSVLDSFSDRTNNKTFFDSMQNKALLITFETNSASMGSDLLDSFVPRMSVIDCADRVEWKTLLWDRNFLSPHSGKSIVIHSVEDLEALKKAVVANAIINENGGFDKLAITKFKAGRVLSMPKGFEDKKIVLDYNVANLFSNSRFYLNNFYNNLDQQMKVVEVLLERTELNDAQ